MAENTTINIAEAAAKLQAEKGPKKVGIAALVKSVTGKKKPEEKKAPQKGQTIAQTPIMIVGDKLQLQIPLKSGRPYLPNNMIRIEVGTYENQTVKERTGYTGIGVALVSIGFPTPDGGFFAFSTQQHRIETKGSKIRLIGPQYVKGDEEEGAAKYYATASIDFQDRVCRTVARALAEKLTCPISELYAQGQGYSATYTYDTNPSASETSLELDE